MQQHMGLTSAEMNKEITIQHEHLIDVLKAKHINYHELKYALIPSKDRKEALLVFDTTKISDLFYGRVVMEQVLSCLDNLTTHSFLAGDFIDVVDSNDFNPLTLMKEKVSLPSHTRYCAELFLVYINNLSVNQFSFVNDFFGNLPYFVGCVDVTFTSPLKDYVSYILGTSFIKHKKTIISVHEDDRSESEDVNIHHYPFEDFGYKVRSLPQYLFSIFLNYKIESIITGSDVDDIGISIQSISPVYDGLKDFTVYVEDKKLKYLMENKQGTLKKVGGLDISTAELESVILNHITSCYIFNLNYSSNYDVSKFNIMFEVEDAEGLPHKVVASLEFIYTERKLRLLTLF